MDVYTSSARAALDTIFRGDKGARRIHMLGVNGISMSGLAELLLARGFRVSGSDLNESERTAKLAGLGATILRGNRREHVDASDPPDMLVYSAAAGPDNPERVRAAELGVPCVERADLLGRIMDDYGISIGVAGTHGKTTTSAMTASILLDGGLDPTINIGGEYGPIGGTGRIGRGDIFLAEACEYVDTFLKLHPTVAVITNIEYDHSDYFRDLAHLRESFARYCANAGLHVVANADDANVAVVKSLYADRWGRGDCGCGGKRWVTFGIKSHDADFNAENIRFDERGCASFNFVAREYGYVSPEIKINVPGIYNVYNGLAAAAAAITAGCGAENVAGGLAGFRGVKKRFEYKGSVGGFFIYDDYAHHPSEVKCALDAAKKVAGAGKLICVFQPHTYSRTRTFLSEFAEAFASADYTLLADIFPAREADPGDINSAMLRDEINRHGGRADYFPGGFVDIADWIAKRASPGDLVVTMGAGLASKTADILLS